MQSSYYSPLDLVSGYIRYKLVKFSNIIDYITYMVENVGLMNMRLYDSNPYSNALVLVLTRMVYQLNGWRKLMRFLLNNAQLTVNANSFSVSSLARTLEYFMAIIPRYSYLYDHRTIQYLNYTPALGLNTGSLADIISYMYSTLLPTDMPTEETNIFRYFKYMNFYTLFYFDSNQMFYFYDHLYQLYTYYNSLLSMMYGYNEESPFAQVVRFHAHNTFLNEDYMNYPVVYAPVIYEESKEIGPQVSAYNVYQVDRMVIDDPNQEFMSMGLANFVPGYISYTYPPIQYEMPSAQPAPAPAQYDVTRVDHSRPITWRQGMSAREYEVYMNQAQRIVVQNVIENFYIPDRNLLLVIHEENKDQRETDMTLLVMGRDGLVRSFYVGPYQREIVEVFPEDMYNDERRLSLVQRGSFMLETIVSYNVPNRYIMMRSTDMLPVILYYLSQSGYQLVGLYNNRILLYNPVERRHALVDYVAGIVMNSSGDYLNYMRIYNINEGNVHVVQPGYRAIPYQDPNPFSHNRGPPRGFPSNHASAIYYIYGFNQQIALIDYQIRDEHSQSIQNYLALLMENAEENEDEAANVVEMLQELYEWENDYMDPNDAFVDGLLNPHLMQVFVQVGLIEEEAEEDQAFDENGPNYGQEVQVYLAQYALVNQQVVNAVLNPAPVAAPVPAAAVRAAPINIRNLVAANQRAIVGAVIARRGRPVNYIYAVRNNYGWFMFLYNLLRNVNNPLDLRGALVTLATILYMYSQQEDEFEMGDGNIRVLVHHDDGGDGADDYQDDDDVPDNQRDPEGPAGGGVAQAGDPVPNNVIDKREKVYPITSYLDIEKDFYRRTLPKSRNLDVEANVELRRLEEVRKEEIRVNEFKDRANRFLRVRMHSVTRDNFVKEFIERAEKVYTQQYKIYFPYQMNQSVGLYGKRLLEKLKNDSSVRDYIKNMSLKSYETTNMEYEQARSTRLLGQASSLLYPPTIYRVSRHMSVNALSKNVYAYMDTAYKFQGKLSIRYLESVFINTDTAVRAFNPRMGSDIGSVNTTLKTEFYNVFKHSLHLNSVYYDTNLSKEIRYKFGTRLDYLVDIYSVTGKVFAGYHARKAKNNVSKLGIPFDFYSMYNTPALTASVVYLHPRTQDSTKMTLARGETLSRLIVQLEMVVYYGKRYLVEEFKYVIFGDSLVEIAYVFSGNDLPTFQEGQALRANLAALETAMMDKSALASFDFSGITSTITKLYTVHIKELMRGLLNLDAKVPLDTSLGVYKGAGGVKKFIAYDESRRIATAIATDMLLYGASDSESIAQMHLFQYIKDTFDLDETKHLHLVQVDVYDAVNDKSFVVSQIIDDRSEFAGQLARGYMYVTKRRDDTTKSISYMFRHELETGQVNPYAISDVGYERHYIVPNYDYLADNYLVETDVFQLTLVGGGELPENATREQLLQEIYLAEERLKVGILSRRDKDVLTNNEQVVELVKEFTDKLANIELTYETFKKYLGKYMIYRNDLMYLEKKYIGRKFIDYITVVKASGISEYKVPESWVSEKQRLKMLDKSLSMDLYQYMLMEQLEEVRLNFKDGVKREIIKYVIDESKPKDFFKDLSDKEIKEKNAKYIEWFFNTSGQYLYNRLENPESTGFEDVDGKKNYDIIQRGESTCQALNMLVDNMNGTQFKSFIESLNVPPDLRYKYSAVRFETSIRLPEGKSLDAWIEELETMYPYETYVGDLFATSILGTEAFKVVGKSVYMRDMLKKCIVSNSSQKRFALSPNSMISDLANLKKALNVYSLINADVIDRAMQGEFAKVNYAQLNLYCEEQYNLDELDADAMHLFGEHIKASDLSPNIDEVSVDLLRRVYLNFVTRANKFLVKSLEPYYETNRYLDESRKVFRVESNVMQIYKGWFGWTDEKQFIEGANSLLLNARQYEIYKKADAMTLNAFTNVETFDRVLTLFRAQERKHGSTNVPALTRFSRLVFQMTSPEYLQEAFSFNSLDVTSERNVYRMFEHMFYLSFSPHTNNQAYHIDRRFIKMHQGLRRKDQMLDEYQIELDEFVRLFQYVDTSKLRHVLDSDTDVSKYTFDELAYYVFGYVFKESNFDLFEKLHSSQIISNRLDIYDKDATSQIRSNSVSDVIFYSEYQVMRVYDLVHELQYNKYPVLSMYDKVYVACLENYRSGSIYQEEGGFNFPIARAQARVREIKKTRLIDLLYKYNEGTEFRVNNYDELADLLMERDLEFTMPDMYYLPYNYFSNNYKAALCYILLEHLFDNELLDVNSKESTLTEQSTPYYLTSGKVESIVLNLKMQGSYYYCMEAAALVSEVEHQMLYNLYGDTKKLYEEKGVTNTLIEQELAQNVILRSVYIRNMRQFDYTTTRAITDLLVLVLNMEAKDYTGYKKDLSMWTSFIKNTSHNLSYMASGGFLVNFLVTRGAEFVKKAFGLTNDEYTKLLTQRRTHERINKLQLQTTSHKQQTNFIKTFEAIHEQFFAGNYTPLGIIVDDINQLLNARLYNSVELAMTQIELEHAMVIYKGTVSQFFESEEFKTIKAQLGQQIGQLELSRRNDAEIPNTGVQVKYSRQVYMDELELFHMSPLKFTQVFLQDLLVYNVVTEFDTPLKKRWMQQADFKQRYIRKAVIRPTMMIASLNGATIPFDPAYVTEFLNLINYYNAVTLPSPEKKDHIQKISTLYKQLYDTQYKIHESIDPVEMSAEYAAFAKKEAKHYKLLKDKRINLPPGVDADKVVGGAYKDRIFEEIVKLGDAINKKKVDSLVMQMFRYEQKRAKDKGGKGGSSRFFKKKAEGEYSKFRDFKKKSVVIKKDHLPFAKRKFKNRHERYQKKTYAKVEEEQTVEKIDVMKQIMSQHKVSYEQVMMLVSKFTPLKLEETQTGHYLKMFFLNLGL